MAGGNQNNEPAPWEAPGKRHTQMYGAGQAPQQQPPQPQSPYPAAPMPGQAGVPHPPARGPVPYPAAYPQQTQPYPPGAQPYPQGPQPYPPAQGPYGAQSYSMAYPVPKPTSGLAIASLVVMGVGFLGVGVLAWPVGIVLGAIALKQTGPTGQRQGRGMAVAGTIVNSLLTLMCAALLAFVFTMVGKNRDAVRDFSASFEDGQLIVDRVDMYRRDHGDLSSGGNSFIGGYKNQDKVSSPLRVEHLVGAHELKLPIDRYFLEVRTDGATVTYTSADGSKSNVGHYFIPRYDSSDFDRRFGRREPR